MINEILDDLGLTGEDREIQRIQTEHRLRLVEWWNIPEGTRVLEIGCGQGDTTSVLAHTVGEKGLVHGVDIAPESYGAPMTLGQARRRLLGTKIGGRIQIDLNTDFLSDSFAPKGTYDYFVMSHCSWYFSSSGEVRRVLEKARSLARNLCFAEWDVRARKLEQLPHFLSAFLQAECACFAPMGQSNIRTWLTPADLLDIAARAGWRVTQTDSVSSPELQDAKWEVQMLLQDYPDILVTLHHAPEKLRAMLLSVIEMVREKQDTEPAPLDTFVFSAESCP